MARTTGGPKGAVHSQSDMRYCCETYGKHVLEITEKDICYSAARLFFAYGLGNAMFFPMGVGASAVLNPDPPTPANAFRKYPRWIAFMNEPPKTATINFAKT